MFKLGPQDLIPQKLEDAGEWWGVMLVCDYEQVQELKDGGVGVGPEDLQSLTQCQHFYSAITAFAITLKSLKLTQGFLGA